MEEVEVRAPRGEFSKQTGKPEACVGKGADTPVLTARRAGF